MPIQLTAGGMLRKRTPIEHYPQYGLYVKREDLACPPPGPPFSKTRGVYAWVAKQTADLIGVLDTRHSQGGHAVARACQILGKRCHVYYPEFKHEPGHREPQERAKKLGAKLIGLKAGMSAVLWHQARKRVEAEGGIMIPNALKLKESVEETAKEVPDESYDQVLIPISSGTIAAGVIKGFAAKGIFPHYLIHLGYSRSEDQVRQYLIVSSGVEKADIVLVDEGYAYKDSARTGATPPWPCNEYYDLKAFRWWLTNRVLTKTLLWNIG